MVANSNRALFPPLQAKHTISEPEGRAPGFIHAEKLVAFIVTFPVFIDVAFDGGVVVPLKLNPCPTFPATELALVILVRVPVLLLPERSLVVLVLQLVSLSSSVQYPTRPVVREEGVDAGGGVVTEGGGIFSGGTGGAGVTGTVAGGVTTGAMPMPVSGMDLVTFLATSKKEKVPLRVPSLEGVKVMVAVQLPPARTLEQVLVCEKSVLEREISFIDGCVGGGVVTGGVGGGVVVGGGAV